VLILFPLKTKPNIPKSTALLPFAELPKASALSSRIGFGRHHFTARTASI
jgi:hypothetical protein